MRALGVTLIEHGDDFQEAREHAVQLAAQRGAHMVPSFHPDLLGGVSTYWWEFLRAVPQLDVVYVPIGQGSGACSAIAAKLALREDAAACSAQVIELMKKPSADMFWMFPVTCISYLGRDQLTPAAKAAIREAWRTYYPLRGDTENHWVMYYTTMHLMADLWPDEGAERWFNGKTSAEISAESKAFLLHWMELATTIGQ
eukprot:gene64519-88246_t